MAFLLTSQRREQKGISFLSSPDIKEWHELTMQIMTKI